MLHFHRNSSLSLPTIIDMLQTFGLYFGCGFPKKNKKPFCTDTSFWEKKGIKQIFVVQASRGLSSPCCCEVWMVMHTLGVRRVFCQFLGHRTNQMSRVEHERRCRGRCWAAPEQLKNVKSLFSQDFHLAKCVLRNVPELVCNYGAMSRDHSRLPEPYRQDAWDCCPEVWFNVSGDTSGTRIYSRHIFFCFFGLA